MRENGQTRLLQIGGWVLVFIGMFLPTVFIVTQPRVLWFMVPIACAVLTFGLVLVSGRWPAKPSAED